MIFIIFIAYAAIPVYAIRPAIFIISVDGFRPDYLQRNITPNINSLVKSGVSARLRNVFPTVSFTNYVSLFTGCYPENHGIISNVFKNTITGEYFDSRVADSYNSPKWYDAKFIWEYAEKFGIYSSMIYIPGGAIASEYRGAYYFLDQSSHALPKFRVNDAISYLHEKPPYTPQLTAILFDELDNAGHLNGTFHDETNKAIKRIDSLVGTIIDSLKNLNIYENTNIIFLSVHGLADVNEQQTINIGEILFNRNVEIINSGSYAYVYCNPDSVGTIKALLKTKNRLHIYTKEEIPDSLHIKHHPFAPDILIIADYKWLITEKNDFLTYKLKGFHGAPPQFEEMQGVFIASGPAFRADYKIEEVNIIDIYPLLCNVLGINIPRHIDGNLENIKEILK